MRKTIGTLLGFTLGLVLGFTTLLASPAGAHHNMPTLNVGTLGECGQVTIGTSDWPEETHQVATTKLVVQVNDAQHVADVGESITVGPFDAAEVTIRYRVWGGGERDYDSPPLSNLDDLLKHLEYGGGELDFDVPGVAWHELIVYGCVASPSPTPTPTLTPTATASPTPGATESPDASPSASPSPAAGELPITGSSLPLFAGGAAVLIGLGTGLVLLGRRRRVPTEE